MSESHEAKRAKADGDEDPAVTRFRSFLRINTMHPTPDYRMCGFSAFLLLLSSIRTHQHQGAACVFLKQQADEIGLLYREVERELLLCLPWYSLPAASSSSHHRLLQPSAASR